jgi:FAD:protein FMN transferase
MPPKNNYLKIDVIFLAFIVIASFLLLVYTAIKTPGYKSHKTNFVAMDTFFEITVYVKKRPLQTEAQSIQDVFQECIVKVKEIETWGNTFDPSSEISQVNKKASQKEVEINPDFFQVLKYAKKFGHKTNGVFDITVQPLSNFYKDKNNRGKPLPRNIRKQVNYENILLNEEKNTVYLKNKAQITLGGILKGYAVDEVIKILKKNKIEKALVNGGGNIYALGTNEKEELWAIGIKDPQNKAKIWKTIKLQNQGVSTSGNYERGAHIINPGTEKPVLATGSVTVVADSAMQADVLSTAIYVDNGLKDRFEKVLVFER